LPTQHVNAKHHPDGKALPGLASSMLVLLLFLG